ncbi:nicotinamide/nicotinic acid mononucleotide adenylyltransferase 1-like [Stegodyphus dumicola]|uniref:nicotinamide/nicotinic acid mononucleotide adenylyltransferase 1-like n=1 Tax=Stegodyphus dumicola TaxID=202533 RepID=UPI0015AE0BAB|nr:nicotinamide/nicotinic acid mononucleotide adenylyltransferase 1-like [Stegodyphus dumicola]
MLYLNRFSMGTKRRVLLLSCGSFNPITNMHLRMFELAKDYLHKTGLFEVVGGIISPVNDGYGKKELISAKHRCKMVELALQSNDWVKLDHWESEQDGWIPTLKVLEHHQNNLNPVTNINESISVAKKQKLDIENFVNNNSQEQHWDSSLPVYVMLLCGADFLESFGVPGLWDESDIESIVGKHGLVVISRNGTNPQQFVYESDLLSRFQNNIHIVTEWIPNEISSTHIRIFYMCCIYVVLGICI